MYMIIENQEIARAAQLSIETRRELMSNPITVNVVIELQKMQAEHAAAARKAMGVDA